MNMVVYQQLLRPGNSDDAIQQRVFLVACSCHSANRNGPETDTFVDTDRQANIRLIRRLYLEVKGFRAWSSQCQDAAARPR